MKTIRLTEHNTEEAAAMAVEFLQEGGVVLLPTDTAYALAADATNQQAVEQVVLIKGRDSDQPISVVVEDRAQAESLAEFSPEAAAVWSALMPGPLTIVLPYKGKGLADGIVKDGTVGLRYPKHDLALLVAERLERPYTATSANRSGEPPAYSVAEFMEDLPIERNPHCAIDAGQLEIGAISTVVSLVDGFKVLREGNIPEARIRQVIEQA